MSIASFAPLGGAEPSPRKFVPSPQQQAVFDWVESGRGNAFIEAVAGAGKTTTLIEACKRIELITTDALES